MSIILKQILNFLIVFKKCILFMFINKINKTEINKNFISNAMNLRNINVYDTGILRSFFKKSITIFKRTITKRVI